MESPEAVFVEEIDLRELQFLEMVGRGSFGVVKRAVWRQAEVAVKLIETEQERKAFITELKQLSRVNHPNIVKLYGACTKHPVCLVMEYAEGGSLYNVLHRTEGPKLTYNSSQAMNWMLQCALGVEYLHSMKPKPLIHRDLKPPNLLLQAGGTVLKICDFGTACDAHTHMTNNKGSAAWMAPEVFEGSRYSEKCDIYSWGIILWEVLTRRKPFDEIGASAFRIMWQVHNGTRPPLIKNFPQCIELLMKRCWSSNPVERPPMIEVVRIVKYLMQYFPGASEPLVYPIQIGDGTPGTPSSVYDTPPLSNMSEIGGPTLRETVRKGEPVPITPVTPKSKPLVVEDKSPRFGGRTSAPASLAASRESLLDGKGSRSSTPSIDFKNKRYSADLSKMVEQLEPLVRSGQIQQAAPAVKRGHRRTGSHGTPFVSSSPNSNLLGPSWSPVSTGIGPRIGHRRTGSYGNSPIATATNEPLVLKPIMHVSTSPAILDATASTPTHTTPSTRIAGGYSQTNPQRSISWNPDITTGYPCVPQLPPQQQQQQQQQQQKFFYDGIIDHQLQPLPPCATCPDSVNIYTDHCKVVEDYVKIMAEITWLKKRKEVLQKEQELEEKEDVDSARSNEEFNSLVNENESLSLLHENLKKQFEQIKSKRQGVQ